ncbi:hypothetical protein JQ628_05335 [Bradyrhizobium lablabi]|uniref:hypothetical protein n=1 Tax=Bradyrhizobium lablabi TaxID=722472 RepID=UPI001BACF6B9|nr:hypothetical protein [Bradyrhizobium lablabi]MBR1120931.1 hypothetical protein [Bradyrhizobium lablabi]
MTKADANRYRKQAAKCRRLAVNAASRIEREALHQMADEWLKLAQRAKYVSRRP